MRPTSLHRCDQFASADGLENIQIPAYVSLSPYSLQAWCVDDHFIGRTRSFQYQDPVRCAGQVCEVGCQPYLQTPPNVVPL